MFRTDCSLQNKTISLVKLKQQLSVRQVEVSYTYSPAFLIQVLYFSAGWKLPKKRETSEEVHSDQCCLFTISKLHLRRFCALWVNLRSCVSAPPVRESFALVKGAVHLLEEGDKDDAEDETASSPTSPAKESDVASEARRRQLHAMVEQLRPEDTMKLVNSLVFAEWICQTCQDQGISTLWLVYWANLLYQHL